MHIAVSGSSGLLGSALVPALRARGHDVARLVRRPAQSADEISWDPMQGTVDMARFAETACVVHLAGVGVGDHRWTESYKAEILRSRVDGTATISRALAAIGGSTSLVCGSAIGFYGDTGDRAVDESAPVGRGFLADVVRQWEDSAQPAIDAGVRTCFARTGLVVSAQGGAWARLFPIFRAGLGGRIGSGRQYMSFISLRLCAADCARGVRRRHPGESADPPRSADRSGVRMAGPRYRLRRARCS